MATAVLNEKHGTISAFDTKEDAEDFMSEEGGVFIVFHGETFEEATLKARAHVQECPHELLRGHDGCSHEQPEGNQ